MFLELDKSKYSHLEVIITDLIWTRFFAPMFQNHALVNCPFARAIWDKIFIWWGLGPFVGLSVHDIISFNLSSLGNKWAQMLHLVMGDMI